MLHDTPRPGKPPAGEPFEIRLGNEIATLCAHLDAAQFRLLRLLHLFDLTEGWSGWKSCAHWLSWRTGLSPGAARERVRVARRLAELPLISAQMKRGRLSWSKVRALTRFVTADSEARLVDFALHHTASQIERFARAQRSAEAALAAVDGESEMAHRRHLSIHVDHDGMYRIRGRLLPQVGALLMRALDEAGNELYRRERAAEREADAASKAEATGTEARDTETPDSEASDSETPEAATKAEPAWEPAWEPGPLRLPRTPGERRHDALEAWLEDRTDAKVQLVVHTVARHADVVATEDGSCVPAGTSRRLSCDAEAVRVERGTDGSVLDVGRRRRTVGWRLRKALEVRDGGCRFPGCGSRYTQAHHAIPWAEGGRTALDNLILLCRFHHRMVHEGGWRVEMPPGGLPGAARFRDPAGRIVPAVPPADADVKAPPSTDAGLGRWHRQKGVNPWTATREWEGDRLDVDWALWVLWGQFQYPMEDHVRAA